MNILLAIARRIGQRFLSSIPALLGVVIVTFVLMRVMPGDPAVFFASGPSAGKAEIEELRHKMGLDQPVPIQLVRYLEDIAHGNLGRSLTTGQAVKASFNYTVTDLGGLKGSSSITLMMTGSTSDKGVNLNGGNGNDLLSGSATNNAEDVLQGGNGDDSLFGYGGTDALYGGNGDDKLSGGAGIDYLYGDSGNDTLDGGIDGDVIFGGKGNDVLIGGTGADKFVFEPQSGSDRIMDFNMAEGDKLYFANLFSTPITQDAFVAKYVTDTGNDLLINLPGASIVLVGVPSVDGLAGAIVFGMPS